MDIATGKLVIAGKVISPPLLLAPMAGITHSAFRRLVADFGGHGALFTEMLSTRAICAEEVFSSPFTRKRPGEGNVIYQLGLIESDTIRRVIEKLSTLDPFGIDINLGCSAPEVKRRGGGIVLFEDRDRLREVLTGVRSEWKGVLTVKCRLGNRSEAWQKRFIERLRIIEDAGVDAVTAHPRFSDEKLKRNARHEFFPWIASQTHLPLIANGDIADVADVQMLLTKGQCSGCMIGRMAVVKPWIFRELSGAPTATIDYREIWNRFCNYTCEDFRPEKVMSRIREFGRYFSCNFFYGHELFRAAIGSQDLDTLRSRANDFLSRNPTLANEPSVSGI